MRIPRTVSFTNPSLYQEIENYAKKRNIDFSQAVAELSEAGISLFKKAGSLNIENISNIEYLMTKVDYLDGEVKKLWALITNEPTSIPALKERVKGGHGKEKGRMVRVDKEWLKK